MIKVAQFGAVAAFVALMLTPGVSRADGAIAHSRSGGENGISYNYRGPRAADDAAVENCGSDCRVVERFRHSCGAVAKTRAGGYGFAVRDRLGEAKRAAMENCEGQNNGCFMFLSGCDD